MMSKSGEIRLNVEYLYNLGADSGLHSIFHDLFSKVFEIETLVLAAYWM